MTKLVSVLMPAYNAQRWIEQTLYSALNQTWKHLEIIVVDDGSQDQTTDVVRALRSPRIKLICQNNGGPCVARNHAYAHAQGDYIQWLDADDLLAPEKIARQIERLQAHGDDMAVAAGPTGVFRELHTKARFSPDSCWQDLAPRELLIRKFTDNAHIVIHAWLIGRRLADAAGPWDVRLQKTDADGEYSSRMVGQSSGMLFVPDARCYYRKGIAGSLSATRSHMDQERLLLVQLFDNLLALENSEQTRQACARWLQLWAMGYYMVHAQTPQTVVKLVERFNLPPVRIVVPAKFRVAETVLGWRGAVRMRLALASLRRMHHHNADEAAS